MRFSICIPNYNYARYLGRTIQSVLDQTYQDFEIVVCDNCSTDESANVVRGFGDARIKLNINACNVGFAGNLDRAARMATGDVMIMLSSDDLMRPQALETYANLYAVLGDEAPRTVLSSSPEVIDSDDSLTGRIEPEPLVWKPTDARDDLGKVVDGTVYGVPIRELHKRCLLSMKTPFFFACTAYPRKLYEEVEGYGGGRLINPDKWFSWKLLSVADAGYFVDLPLFAYRVHASNQNSLQAAQGALKFMVDEYVSSFEVDKGVLEKLSLTREDLEQAFVEHDVARHGLATLARGERQKARRVLAFGRAVYPWHVRRNRKARILGMLLSLGPIGGAMARLAYNSYQQRSNGEQESE